VDRHAYSRTPVSSNCNTPTKNVGLPQNRNHRHLIECNLFLTSYSLTLTHLEINNIKKNHKLLDCRKGLMIPLQSSWSIHLLFIAPIYHLDEGLCCRHSKGNLKLSMLFVHITSKKRLKIPKEYHQPYIEERQTMH
jgi:hypothetical protein